MQAAEQLAELLLEVHLVPDARGLPRLRRVSRDGVVGAPAGVLEDYGDVAEGLLTLHCVTGGARWLAAAGDLLETVLTVFADGAGSFFDTADDATDPALEAVRRPRDPTEGPHPSGVSAAAGALLTFAALTGSARHREAAEAALGVAAAVGPRAPRAVGWALAVAQARLAGPHEVAVVGPVGDPGAQALHAAALASTSPGAVVSVGVPDAEGVPLLAGRTLIGGAAAAYVCRDFVCDLPTSDPDELAAALGSRPHAGTHRHSA